MPCAHAKGEVLETRRYEGAVYRRRQCHLCELRYVTVETLHNGSIPKPPSPRLEQTQMPSQTPEEKRQEQRMADGAAALAAMFK